MVLGYPIFLNFYQEPTSIFKNVLGSLVLGFNFFLKINQDKWGIRFFESIRIKAKNGQPDKKKPWVMGDG